MVADPIISRMCSSQAAAGNMQNLQDKPLQAGCVQQPIVAKGKLVQPSRASKHARCLPSTELGTDP